MIPIRLELKNFMSYGNQVMPLDFTGIHLACLCGDNGNGKSALLDAITWVLWGEGRASADELIRLGTDEMRVMLDFQLGDDLYRVIRSRSKRSAGNVWEIYIAENPSSIQGALPGVESAAVDSQPDELQFRPITGQGIRDTGRVIQRILRMDYKTFINSAYIQQGRADEFTKQTVADRKKILADILDLSRYDVLEQKAKERRNEAEQRVQELEREIGHIEAELAGEDEYRQQLEESKSARDSLESQIAQVETRVRELQARQSELESSARLADEKDRQVAAWRSEIENLLSQKLEQERRIAESREILKDKERILAGQEKLRITRELVTQLNTRLDELRALEHEKTRLDQQVLTEKHKLELERQSLSKESAELKSKIASAPGIEADVQSLRAKVDELEKLEARRSMLQSEFSAQADRLGLLKAQHTSLVDEVKPELEEKLRLISEPGAECPICHTELGHDKHESIIADYKQRIADIDARITRVKKEGSEAKAKRDSAQQESDSIDRDLKAGLEVRKRLAQAEQLLFQISEYRKQAPEVAAGLKAVSCKLESGEYASDEVAMLNEIAGRIAALEYDPDNHRRMKDSLGTLEKFESLVVRLKHAEERLPSDESSLSAVSELIATREKAVAECEVSIRQLRASAVELPAVTSELAEVGKSLQTLRESDRQITGRIATLEHALERCKTLRAEVSGRRKKLEQANRDKGVYTELVAAFGKKGVQALIIENAIPEIQDEANRLLARMTDNSMQVSIETVKEKKTGGAAETLDIRISDEMGTRSYDLYSGGEAFRVNFALRIALSKLLARRAGARLQTLIIDEGFGTQDAKGREKLIESIDSIKDDFEKILVITHIDELKDAFPTRIEITKDSQGSQISVN